jgi:hypothetical protein
MTETPWMLGRGIKSEGLTTWDVDRQLSDTDLEAFSRADRVVGAMNAPNLLGGVGIAQRELTALSERLLAGTTADRSGAARQGWSRALDDWLAQYNSTRARVKTDVGVALGWTAAEAADKLFDTAYRNDPHYRLTWELRNAAQHGHRVLDFTRTGFGVDHAGRSLEVWLLDIEGLYAVTGPKEVLALQGLVGTAKQADMLDLIEDATASIYAIVSEIWRDNSAAIRGAADHVLALAAEFESKPGVPFVFQPSVAEPQPSVKLRPIRDDIATALIAVLPRDVG